MPYSPVIDDCAEVKRLLFRVTYRLASIFSHITTKAIPDTRACVQLDIQVHHEEHRSVAQEVWLLTSKITLGESV